VVVVVVVVGVVVVPRSILEAGIALGGRGSHGPYLFNKARQPPLNGRF